MIQWLKVYVKPVEIKAWELRPEQQLQLRLHFLCAVSIKLFAKKYFFWKLRLIFFIFFFFICSQIYSI